MDSGLAFLHSGANPVCSTLVDKHFDDYFTLQFMDRGSIELYYGDSRHELRGSWFWTCYPGPRVRFHPACDGSTWSHRYVAFRGDLVGRWIAAGLWFAQPQPAPEGIDCLAMFDELLKHAQGADRWAALRAANQLEGILLALAEARSQPAPRELWLNEALEGLRAEESYMPDYALLAARCGMGLSTLRRRFKQATGTALHAYVLQRRLARARELLGESDLPVKAIAEQLGYCDVFFFTRQFHRMVGVTPVAYRRSRQS